GLNTADIYYRRNLWLMAFGMLHAYLFWPGDILFFYGATGLILFAFRKQSPSRLLILAAACVLVLVNKNIGAGFETIHIRDKGQAAIAAEKAGQKLTEEQQEQKKKWEDHLKEAKPPAAELKKEVDHHRNVVALIGHRLDEVARVESLIYYRFIFFDVCGAM